MPVLSNIEGLNNLNTESFSWTPDYLEPSAWIDHIPFAFWLVDTLRPNTFLELGVYNATSYFSFCQAIERLNISTKAYAVDNWKGDEHAGFYGEEIYQRVSAYNDRKYSKFSTLIRSSFEDARPYFSDKSIDLLHIDGLHTYEAVKADFELWFPALSEDAVILFHDINVRDRGFGVFKFWDELKLTYPSFEFDYGFGLGIIALGNNYHPVLQSLLSQNKKSTYYTLLKNNFSTRGIAYKQQINFIRLQIQYEEIQNKLKNSEFKEKNEREYALTLKENIRELNEILENKTDELKKVSEEKTTTKQSLLSLNKEHESLKNILAEYKQKISESQNNLQLKLKNEGKWQEETQHTISALTSIIDELKNTITNHQLEKNTLLKKNHRLQRNWELQKEIIKELGDQLQIKEGEYEKLVSEKEEIVLKIQQMKFTAENKELQLTSAIDQINNLRKELAESNEQKEQIQMLVADQISYIKKIEYINNNAAIQITTYTNNISELSEVKQKLQNELSELEKNYCSTLDESSTLRSIIEEKDVQIQTMTRELLERSKVNTMPTSNIKNGSPVTMLNWLTKKIQQYPRLHFHLKKNILELRWRLKGTIAHNKYKTTFWKNHRNIPFNHIEDYIQISNSGLFDSSWYLSKYQDVQKENSDPILHFLQHGFYEGRDPSPSFSTLKYLQYYPDVRQSSVNALTHYIYKGKAEGRRIFPTNEAFPSNNLSQQYKMRPPNIPSAIPEPIISAPSNSLLNTGFTERRKKTIEKIKKIAFIAQPEYFSFHYTNVFEDEYSVGYFSTSFSEDPNFFKDLTDFDADINIFFRGELIPQQTLNSLSGINVALSSEPFPKIINNSVKYTADSLGRFEFFLTIFKKNFDYIFHYDEISRLFFETNGINLSGYFPFPIATDLIKPKNVEKKWDIFFSGRSTEHREKFFGPLKRDFNFLHINHGVVGQDLIDFICRSKIAINIHAEDELSWEPRTQFLMAAGALLISEALSPTCPLRPGIDYIQITDPWNAYETCRDVLENYEKYKHIAENGRKRIEETLCSKNNFSAFFHQIVQGEYVKQSFNESRLNLTPLKTNLQYNGFAHLLTELVHEHA